MDDELVKIFKLSEVNSTRNHNVIELAKSILKKTHTLRSWNDVEKISQYLKNVQFFKDRKIRDKDLDELVSACHFESFTPGEKIMEYGEPGSKFYIQIKGVVSVSIPNSQIRNWRMKRFMFLQD